MAVTGWRVAAGWPEPRRMPFSLQGLFLVVLKSSEAIHVGRGYVLVAFHAIETWAGVGYGSYERQLPRRDCVGQVTPGTIPTAPTFIGTFWTVFHGAAVATVDNFLAGFCAGGDHRAFGRK